MYAVTISCVTPRREGRGGKTDNGRILNAYACCPLMQFEQGPAFGCPVLCIGSVQLAKRLQRELSCTHVHHLQSSFLPQNLWQASAVSIFSKLTEYSWNIERGKHLNQDNFLVQCLAEKLYPCCVTEVKIAFSSPSIGNWKIFHTKPCWMCVKTHIALSPDIAFQFLRSIHDLSVPLL